MKKKAYGFILFLLLISVLIGCSSNNTVLSTEPDLAQIRSICELATLKCYYHNVAKGKKIPEKGIQHIGEKERDFWIEYDGTVKLGIDMSKVKMEVKEDSITITIPEAKVLQVEVDSESYNEESYVMSKDGLNSNKITAQDATDAVNKAKGEMKKTAQENSLLLMNAQDRAKELIENYINQIGEATGTMYTINWEYTNK